VRDAHREHELIVDAIAARNPAAAEAAARQHIHAAQRMVLSNWLEDMPS
jgi:DNA-binding GntR family transcriptional regulator